MDSTHFMILLAIASEQSAPTQSTIKCTCDFLDYLDLLKTDDLTYRASNLKLAVHSNAGYNNVNNGELFTGFLDSGSYRVRLRLSKDGNMVQQPDEVSFVVP